MRKEILKRETDPELNSTQLVVRVPEFENFGGKMEDIQEEAEAAWLADPESPETMIAATERLNELTKNTLAQLEEKLKSMPEGAEKEQMRLGLEMFEKMQSALTGAEDDDEVGDDLDDDEDEWDSSEDDSVEDEPDVLRVLLAPGMEWNEQQEARLDEFLRRWPGFKGTLLKAVFQWYEEIYPEAMEMYGESPARELVLPEPTCPEAISDLFKITSIELHESGRIGIGGRCTWEEEHGLGILIEGDRILRVGYADESYDE